MSEKADHNVIRRNPMLPRDPAQGQAGEDLAPHHAPPVAYADFAERQRADDRRGGLRSRVAAARDDQRDEQRQHDRLGNVERFAVLSVGADVIEDLANRPLLADRDVVRRHQPPDRFVGIAQQRQGYGAFSRREQGEELPRGPGRQFLDEQGALVRRHVVQQLGHVVLCHGLQQRFLRVLREILEHVCRRGRRG
jgi:hypothetical protein